VFLVFFLVVAADRQLVLLVPLVTVEHEIPYSSEGCPTVGRIMLVRHPNGTFGSYQVMRLP